MYANYPPPSQALFTGPKTQLNIEFKALEFAQSLMPLNVRDLEKKHIIFVVEGSIYVGYNLFQPVEFSAGEMFFLPPLATCTGWTLSACKLIVLSYDNSIHLYDESEAKTIEILLSAVDYRFESLSIVPVLSMFLTGIGEYLELGIPDNRLHEVKQQELFWIFTSCYSKRALVKFFYPVLGQMSDFRSYVLAHCMHASSVKNLASLLGYSERCFRDVFCTEFNELPYEWLQKQKAKHIVMRLAQSDVQLKELIEEFNFSSPSHLHKFCMKHYQLTPGQLKRELSAKHICVPIVDV